LVIFLLSWYHWSDTTWIRKLQAKYHRITNVIHRSSNKTLASSSSSLQDDDELGFLDEKNDIEDIRDESKQVEEYERSHKTNEDKTFKERKKVK